MRGADYLKALATGALVLALNLLTLVLLVFGYSQIVEPGQTPEYYATVAPRIGAWSGPIAGAVFMFLGVWLLTRRNPERSAYAFAGTVFASYVVIDVAIGLAAAPVSALLRPGFLLGLAGVGVAAFVAARVARGSRS